MGTGARWGRWPTGDRLLNRREDKEILHPPVNDLPRLQLDTLAKYSLFLDLDGTLFELVDRPDEVVADDQLRRLLIRLSEKLEGRLAVVSGRSVAQIDAMLGPLAQALNISGSHGSEHRWQGLNAVPMRPAALNVAADNFRAFAGDQAGILVEEKSFGTALHYRMAPELEEAAVALAQKLAEELGLQYQPGNMMAELRIPGGDKGTAIRLLMDREPMAGTLPVFLGDDDTDEAGFLVAQELGGAGVIVGGRRPTNAQYAIPDPRAVHDWLEELSR